MDVNLAFIDCILPSSVSLAIVPTPAYRFAFLVVMLVMPTFTARSVFTQSILVVL